MHGAFLADDATEGNQTDSKHDLEATIKQDAVGLAAAGPPSVSVVTGTTGKLIYNVCRDSFLALCSWSNRLMHSIF